MGTALPNHPNAEGSLSLAADLGRCCGSINKNIKDDQINFRILFRSPKYPVIVIAEDDIWPAFDIEELGTICVISEPVDDSYNIIVIDCNGEEFWYLPEQIVLAPGFMRKKWTKRHIIELFNDSETAKEKNIQYPLKSLSNKRLSMIVTDIWTFSWAEITGVRRQIRSSVRSSHGHLNGLRLIQLHAHSFDARMELVFWYMDRSHCRRGNCRSDN